MREKTSVISLISYDADFLVDSIKSYYEYVDEIVLGLDQDRISWSRNKFSFDETKLLSELSAIDGDSKINIIEGNFHRSSVPIENDTHERNFLKANCEHDWIFSFDADEVLVNAKDFFTKFFPLVQNYKDIELMFTWYLMYKKVEDGYLIISEDDGHTVFSKDIQGFSANKNLHTYTYCRWTNSEKKILSPLAIKHFSFCRDDKDLSMKINNFGHSAESKVDPFYTVQKQVTKDNYTQLRNFKTHGAGAQWPALKFVKEQEVDSYLQEQARFLYAR